MAKAKNKEIKKIEAKTEEPKTEAPQQNITWRRTLKKRSKSGKREINMKLNESGMLKIQNALKDSNLKYKEIFEQCDFWLHHYNEMAKKVGLNVELTQEDMAYSWLRFEKKTAISTPATKLLEAWKAKIAEYEARTKKLITEKVIVEKLTENLNSHNISIKEYNFLVQKLLSNPQPHLKQEQKLEIEF